MQDTDTTGRDLIRNNDQFAVHYRSYYTANNLRNQLFDLKWIPFFFNKKWQRKKYDWYPMISDSSDSYYSGSQK